MNDLISEYQHYLVSEKMKSENSLHGIEIKSILIIGLERL